MELRRGADGIVILTSYLTDNGSIIIAVPGICIGHEFLFHIALFTMVMNW